jgi:hypothetical protein
MIQMVFGFIMEDMVMATCINKVEFCEFDSTSSQARNARVFREMNMRWWIGHQFLRFKR